MQFTPVHKIGQQKIQITFESNHGPAFWSSLMRSFTFIGGKCCEAPLVWEFPMHVTSQIISEIIHNTCFVCGGLMQDSTAFQNTLVASEDFGGDASNRGTTQSRTGQALHIKVRKCVVCGHSHT